MVTFMEKECGRSKGLRGTERPSMRVVLIMVLLIGRWFVRDGFRDSIICNVWGRQLMGSADSVGGLPRKQQHAPEPKPRSDWTGH